MKKSLAIIGPVFLTLIATLIWGLPGTIFTMSFCGLIVSLSKDKSQMI